ncbi:MAG: thermonuclease family protein [Planctomycetota bacterium]
MSSKPRRILTAIFVLFLSGLSVLDHAGAFGHRGVDRDRYTDVEAVVTHAADGGTFDVDIPDGTREVTRIRQWGVECPEIAHGTSEADAWFVRNAAEYIRSQVVGQRVRLVLEPYRPSRDKYGRLLAYVYLVESAEMLNETLLDRGLAYADQRFEHVMKFSFEQREKRAAKTGVGLWKGITPDQMPEWRQRMDAEQAR